MDEIVPVIENKVEMEIQEEPADHMLRENDELQTGKVQVDDHSYATILTEIDEDKSIEPPQEDFIQPKEKVMCSEEEGKIETKEGNGVSDVSKDDEVAQGDEILIPEDVQQPSKDIPLPSRLKNRGKRDMKSKTSVSSEASNSTGLREPRDSRKKMIFPKRNESHSSTFIFVNQCRIRDKIYECSFCNYKSRREPAFGLHFPIHSGGKPYKCSHCGYTFPGRRHLSTRARIHTEENPIKCSQCDFVAMRRQDLRRHERNHKM